MLIHEQNFVTIQGWMRTELELSGNDLMVYAIIYSFSQTEGQKFTGSLQYLADWCGATKQGIMKNLKRLIDKGLIIKEDYYEGGIKLVKYHTTKLHTPLNKVTYPIKQSLINNKEDNKDNKKENTISKDIVESKDSSVFDFGSSKKPTKENLYMKCIALINDFTKDMDNEEFRLTLIEFLNARLQIKDKPFYTNNLKGILKKIQKWLDEGNSIDKILEWINYSIEKGYTTVYEQKDKKQHSNSYKPRVYNGPQVEGYDEVDTSVSY